MDSQQRRWLALNIGLLLMLAVAQYSDALLSPVPLVDEGYYVSAAQAVLAGTPLSKIEGWYYSSIAAAGFAGSIHLLGQLQSLMLLRLLNLLGICLALGLSSVTLAGLGSRRLWRSLPLSAVFFIGLDTVEYGIVLGNISGALVLPLLIATLVQSRWLRIAALSVGAPLKPYSIGLALSRRGLERALPIAALVVSSLMTHRVTLNHLFSSGNGSLGKTLAQVGIPWQVTTVVVAGLGMVFLREKSWARGMVLSWLALPIVWHHTTLLLLVPWALSVQAIASTPAAERRSLKLLGAVMIGLILAQSRRFGLGPDGLLGVIYSGVPAAAAMALLYLTRDADWMVD